MKSEAKQQFGARSGRKHRQFAKNVNSKYKEKMMESKAIKKSQSDKRKRKRRGDESDEEEKIPPSEASFPIWVYYNLQLDCL